MTYTDNIELCKCVWQKQQQHESTDTKRVQFPVDIGRDQCAWKPLCLAVALDAMTFAIMCVLEAVHIRLHRIQCAGCVIISCVSDTMRSNVPWIMVERIRQIKSVGKIHYNKVAYSHEKPFICRAKSCNMYNCCARTNAQTLTSIQRLTGKRKTCCDIFCFNRRILRTHFSFPLCVRRSIYLVVWPWSRTETYKYVRTQTPRPA